MIPLNEASVPVPDSTGGHRRSPSACSCFLMGHCNLALPGLRRVVIPLLSCAGASQITNLIIIRPLPTSSSDSTNHLIIIVSTILRSWLYNNVGLCNILHRSVIKCPSFSGFLARPVQRSSSGQFFRALILKWGYAYP